MTIALKDRRTMLRALVVNGQARVSERVSEGWRAGETLHWHERECLSDWT